EPKKICHKLDQISRNFWWGDKEGQRKMHFMKWDKICRRKVNGGLGISKTESVNRALLANQVWRIVKEDHTILKEIIVKKYCNSEEFMQV
ncbi:hypothetical protein J1N35_000768, partial [Gossypium stocksii]